MTPLEKAKEILAEIESFAAAQSIELPSLRYAQVGGQVVSCAGLIVAATQVGIAPSVDPTCGASQEGTFIVTLTRDCAIAFNDDGSDNPEGIQKLSTEADADGQMLWDYANQLPIYLSRSWSLSWANVGGVSVTTLSLTIGID